ncbi:hypothetical protein FGO68_gene12691 [Halteria grandinella]|uniref:Uncharacterized protein n=1 Tax=Halteria grandinella TaxID=5974 RepID=A0A8J8T4X8_HALGN|nr:hypothetical protein FGO68_gene12691 [Halteria grandinella]
MKEKYEQLKQNRMKNQETLNDQKDELRKKEESKKQCDQSIQRKEQQVKQKEDAMRVLKEKQQQLLQQIKMDQQEKDKLKQELEQINQDMELLKKEIAQLEEQIKEFIEKIAALEKTIEKLKEAIHQQKSQIQEQVELQDAHNQILREVNSNIQSRKRELAKFTVALSVATAAASSCGPCGRAFWSGIIAGLQSQIQSVNGELNQLRQRESQEEEILLQIAIALAKLRGDLKLNEALHDKTIVEHNQAKQQLQNLEKELKAKQERLNELDNKRNQILEKLQNETLSPNELETKRLSLHSQKSILEDDLRKILSEQTQLSTQIGEYQQRIRVGEGVANELMKNSDQQWKQLTMVQGYMLQLDYRNERTINALDTQQSLKMSLKNAQPYLDQAVSERAKKKVQYM